MNFRALAVRFALMAACILTTALPAQASASKSRFWQCAPYAREVSGVNIHGNAWTWWDQAAGKYERGEAPKLGAVMSFRKTARNPFGHVAMVSNVISDREVLLTHANWSFAGGIERNVRAVDVSPQGDWSEVKVWFAPNGGLGTSVYPINGFIYSNGTPDDDDNEATIKRLPSLELDLSDLIPETGI